MGRVLLAVVMSGLVIAGCTPPSLQAEEQVLIRNGFVVPPGRLLLIDDMSVECVIASEVFDEQEFHKVGVEATALLRIEYPPDACPEPLELSGGGNCPSQDYVVGTGAARGMRALFIQPGTPARFVLRVGAGRAMNVFAGGGAKLTGICQATSANIINSFISAGSGRLVAPPVRPPQLRGERRENVPLTVPK